MDEDMDSLFEGMILITPTTQSDPPHPSPPSPPPSLPQPQSPVEKPDNKNDDTSSPLDENLFSDLTLVTDPSPPPAPTPTPILSHQISSTNRKKKKASTLRIGYGRSESSSSPSSSSSATIVTEDTEYDIHQTRTGDNKTQSTSSTQNHIIPNIPQSSPSSSPTIITQDGDHSSDINQTKTQPSNETKTEEEDGGGGGGEGSLDMEKRFEEIRKGIMEKIKEAKEGVEGVCELRKEAIRRRRKVSESLIQANERFRGLEEELGVACEDEDFEKADVVSQRIGLAEEERERLVVAVRNAEVECDELDSKMVEVLERQIRVEDECAALLNKFAGDAADNADLIMKNAEALFSKEMEEWLSSSEVVDLKRITLEIESHIMHDTRSGLDNLIEESLGDDHKEKDILYKRKETLTEELEKLLALVKKKEAEIEENNLSIVEVEKRIAGAVTGFEEVQLSVNAEYDKLQSALSQVENDNESLTKRKEEIDAHCSLEEHRGFKIRELSRSSMDEANAYLEDVGVRKDLLQVVTRYKEDKERLAKMEEKLSEDVQSLKHEISDARSSIQDLSSTKSSLQQETESIKQRLIFIDKRAPELEAEKKVAASTRNFKEAARVSAEAKALSVEKEELQMKVDAMVLDLKKLEETISSTVEKIQATEEQMAIKEKELAVARFQRLTLVAGSAAAERSAALELGDIGEADVLLMEAESANAEAAQLQTMYDIKDDEIANLPKYFISAELLSKLQDKQLEGLSASAKIQGL